MKSLRKHSRILAVAISCLAVGAGASAIANAGAASPSNARGPLAQVRDWRGFGSGRLRAEALRLVARRAVHGDLVVWTKQGFVTITFDRGTVSSVSGQQLVVNEGNAKATYKQVTLTIPASAVVRDNRQKATLSQLQQGQRVIVVQTPNRTFVVAHTPKAG